MRCHIRHPMLFLPPPLFFPYCPGTLIISMTGVGGRRQMYPRQHPPKMRRKSFFPSRRCQGISKRCFPSQTHLTLSLISLSRPLLFLTSSLLKFWCSFPLLLLLLLAGGILIDEVENEVGRLFAAASLAAGATLVGERESADPTQPD